MQDNGSNPVTEEQAITFTQEETLLLVSSMAITVESYEKIIRNVAKMCRRDSLWRQKSGAAFIKHLSKTIEKDLDVLFATQYKLREKNRDIITNKKALDDLIVSVSDLVNSIRENPASAMVDNALIGETVGKYDHEVIGDVIPSETVVNAEDIAISSREEIIESFRQQRIKEGEKLIKASIDAGHKNLMEKLKQSKTGKVENVPPAE